MSEKIQYPKLTTPAGIAKWPKLNKPDTTYKAEGLYTVDLELPLEAAERLLEPLRELYEAHVQECQEKFNRLPVAKRKQIGELKVYPLYQPVYDEETEEETDKVILRFKSVASGISKKTGERWSRSIPVFDSKLKPINLKKVQIWGGSVLKVSFSVMPWAQMETGCGFSFYLNGVQVIELITSGGAAASSLGFGQEEGFDVSEVESNEEAFDAADNTPVDFEEDVPF